MNTILMDPTSELSPEVRERLPRPTSLEGLTVGLLDISKARGNIFIDRIEDLMIQRGISTRRYKKPTFTRIAPVALKQQIATECDLVVESLAD